MSTSSFKETVNTSLRYHKISFPTFEEGVRTYKTDKIALSQLHRCTKDLLQVFGNKHRNSFTLRYIFPK